MSGLVKLRERQGDTQRHILELSPVHTRPEQPRSLARLVVWKVLLKDLAPRMRCSRCGKKAAEVVAAARPRLSGVPKNPH